MFIYEPNAYFKKLNPHLAIKPLATMKSNHLIILKFEKENYKNHCYSTKYIN